MQLTLLGAATALVSTQTPTPAPCGFAADASSPSAVVCSAAPQPSGLGHVVLGTRPPCCAPQCGGSCCLESFQVLYSAHIQAYDSYDFMPPPGGPHDPCWGAWGVHDSELEPYHWVHNMEHGGVVFLYNCQEGGCGDDVMALASLVEGLPARSAILSASSSMTTKFAAVSWGWRLSLDCLSIDAFQAFYNEHVGQGPEALVGVDPPGGCMTKPTPPPHGETLVPTHGGGDGHDHDHDHEHGPAPGMPASIGIPTLYPALPTPLAPTHQWAPLQPSGPTDSQQTPLPLGPAHSEDDTPADPSLYLPTPAPALSSAPSAVPSSAHVLTPTPIDPFPRGAEPVAIDDVTAWAIPLGIATCTCCLLFVFGGVLALAAFRAPRRASEAEEGLVDSSQPFCPLARMPTEDTRELRTTINVHAPAFVWLELEELGEDEGADLGIGVYTSEAWPSAQASGRAKSFMQPAQQPLDEYSLPRRQQRGMTYKH
eukprot:gene5273-942_t